MHIVSSQWCFSRPGIAQAIIQEKGKLRAVDYCPSDSSRSYPSIRDAQDTGTLTGQIDPSPAPSPSPVQTLEDLRAASLVKVEARTKEIFKLGFQVPSMIYTFDTGLPANAGVLASDVRFDAASGERAGLNWTDLGLLSSVSAISAILADLQVALPDQILTPVLRAKFAALNSMVSPMFPKSVETTRRGVCVTISTIADGIMFVLALKNSVQFVTSAGASLLARINAATTIAELNAIVDER